MSTIRMPKVLADKWLAALRSGEYQQGVEELESQNEDGSSSYCCLGVLQVVADGKVQPYDERSADTGDDDELPTSKWLKARGIVFLDSNRKDCCNPHLPTLNKAAAEANDTGVSFVRIADAIEDTLETY